MLKVSGVALDSSNRIQKKSVDTYIKYIHKSESMSEKKQLWVAERKTMFNWQRCFFCLNWSALDASLVLGYEEKKSRAVSAYKSNGSTRVYCLSLAEPIILHWRILYTLCINNETIDWAFQRRVYVRLHDVIWCMYI